MNVQHMKFGMLSAVLVVCTLMISTIDLSQNFVFAQNTTSTLLPSQLPAQDSTSTPATPASGNNDESSSSDANDNSNSNADETSDSSGSADDDNNSEDSDSQQDAISSDGDSSGSEDTTSSEEEDETEDDFEQTNPLLEQIRESVSGALSATGIAVP
ncbi:MAG: hypothetical protein WAM26_03750 [Nitrososphaeraceae archaeon]